MAVCNLFKKIENNNGNFLMFSQYTEDLLKSSTSSGYYKVIPSKFVVINANYNKEILKKYKFAEDNLNIGLPLYLQNDFENGCAIYRNEYPEESNSGNHWSTNIFWNSIMTNPNVTNDNKIFDISQVKYVGDINIQSYNEINGMGYNEIYCFIPSDARPLIYEINEGDGNPHSIIANNEYVEGYNEELSEETHWKVCIEDKAGNKPEYDYARRMEFSFELSKVDDGKIAPKWYDNSFEFNTIIILYKILIYRDSTGKPDVNAEPEVYKEDIPMGIYLTGEIKKDGTVENSHKKYYSNSDIYDLGTSYGLRICSRFTITPQGDSIKTVDTSCNQEGYAAFCQVMSAFADTQDKMNSILDNIQLEDNKYQELYNLFKNSKTNVPYVKTIGDTQYWFVNGLCVGKYGILYLTDEDINLICLIRN